MSSLARCFGIASAERYAQSDHRPSVKPDRIPTAPTAVSITEEKGLQTGEILDSRYAVDTCRGGR